MALPIKLEIIPKRNCEDSYDERGSNVPQEPLAGIKSRVCATNDNSVTAEVA